MRIASLANFVGPRSGGIRTALDAMGAQYERLGVERLLIIPGPRDHVEDAPGGTLVQVKAPSFGEVYRLIISPWKVTELLESFAPNSLELHDKTTMLPVARWARRQGIGTVLFSHERLSDMFAMRTGLDLSAYASIAMLNRIWVRSVDSIVVTSRFGAEEFVRPAQLAGTPIRRIPLGVDLEAFRPPEHWSPSEVLRLVLVGRLSREKSPQLAVATAVELHRRGVPLRLDVYGTGPHLDELQAIAAGAPVYFHGHVSSRHELAQRIGSADVALSVCPSETFGLAALEELACGTPVVTASTGGARESIDPLSGAWAPADPESLADAVLRVAERDPWQRRAAARARAEQFPWSATAESLLEVHQQVARIAVAS